MNLFDLSGKVAVVTGASSGIGADAAIAYAEAGADVAILARRMEKLEVVKRKVEELGRKALAVPCDVSSEESIKHAVEVVLSEYPKIDILLNCAGIAVRGGVEDVTIEDWDKSFDINVRGYFLMSKYILPVMVKNNYGKIVNISSVNAIIADKYDKLIRIPYNSSKAAVVGLTTGMAAAYAKYNITVNAVGPGFFITEMTTEMAKSFVFKKMYNTIVPAGRAGEQGEVNGTILYLSSDASKYVQGQFICVDGGVSIV